MTNAVTAKDARYIKLGSGNRLAKECIEGGTIRLGFDGVPHDLCQAGDWAGVRQTLCELGKAPGAATNQAQQIEDFYTLGSDALWITFWENKLWWTFAEAGVRQNDHPEYRRFRRTISPWRCNDANGEVLSLRNLSTRLTQTAAFRGTLCNVRERDYLLRRINGESEPLVEEALALQAQLTRTAERLVAALHWKDFEILVDRIFADSGWRRIGVLGETQADVDLIIEQTATGERAFVQVKSRATPVVLQDYIERFREYGDCDRMFFVCHSPAGKLRVHSVPAGVEMWFAETVAQKAVRAGLFEWVVERVR
ncbi:MAG TPA: restriction endonuclease [Hyphomonadaceae bacterium]|nr:restriction endonuclease [Hyphomonadaceae bacterium]